MCVCVVCVCVVWCGVCGVCVVWCGVCACVWCACVCGVRVCGVRVRPRVLACCLYIRRLSDIPTDNTKMASDRMNKPDVTEDF